MNNNKEYIQVKPFIIDIDAEMWKQIKEAAAESNWIPKEYYMNDWVSNVCNFLRGKEDQS